MKTTFPVFDKRGFTLVEVLIALLVVGLLFVPVSNAFLQSVKINQHLQQRMTAVREAQAAMEVTLSLLSVFDGADGERPEKVAGDTTEQVSFLNVADSNRLTDVDITPLGEDSPFVMIAATASDTGGAAGHFTLITLGLPGKAPWLTQKEYRVVTP